VLAGQFGWFGRVGVFTGNVATGAANAKVWVTSTAGRVDNTDVAVDIVLNAIQRSATATNLATFAIQNPFCMNEVLNQHVEALRANRFGIVEREVKAALNGPVCRDWVALTRSHLESKVSLYSRH
jgi:hypothetical protein